jgi:DNA-binding protein Fis
MSGKVLDQSVFDGLPPEYRWAAVDSEGRAYAHKCTPKGATAAYWLCVRGCAAYLIGEGYDTTDWQNSLIERPKKPLTQAVFDGLPPEYRWAAVDANGSVHCFHEQPIQTNSGEWIYNKYLIFEDWHDVATNWQNSLTERQDVSGRVEQLRSVEAARKHSHYFKDVSGVDQIDVYAVLRLFEVTDPCLQHIVKKALCAGKRGAKDWAKDVQEIADTAQRLIELESGK